MAEEDRRKEDMVLAPNEYMYVQDETKGHIDIFLGPTKQSLSSSDKPVVFDERVKRFVRASDYQRATQIEKIAPRGWYVVLKNPAKDGKHPSGQGKISVADLDQGRKINIEGPCHFALWPGQMAKIIKGHHLRSNQYLLVRVYDADAARQNWGKGVVHLASSETTPGAPATTAERPAGGQPAASPPAGEQPAVLKKTELSEGQLLVIKGTDISFYIPPTGVEVVSDEKGQLVREAVTLARLEYCLLLDEDGNKRYEQGPAVVFPEPTEVFVEREVEKDGQKVKGRKFRAIELNESSGIYVKVIADYEEGNKSYKTGEELFITGKDTMIYFPREEHAIIKYGSSEVHYGIAIPAGEARYVLNRTTGKITQVKGETVFLPDPRHEVIIRRILDFKNCNLLYPNNIAAFQHNADLLGIDLDTYMREHQMSVANVGLIAAAAATGLMGATGPQGPMGSRGFEGAAGVSRQDAAYSVVTTAMVSNSMEDRGLGAPVGRHTVGDQFQRKNTFTAPRMITLDSKFDGVPQVDVWTGYAVLFVRKSGERRVVKGPQTVLLEYDEFPQALTLSTGKPKTTDQLIRTSFLKTDSNIVTDVVEVETDDFCKLKLKVSYRVCFEGDEKKWFNVENYVKFLCDHMRSRIRNKVQKIGVEQFYGSHTDILRDVVLGEKVDAEGNPRERPGAAFKENGMRIYDVEVLSVEMVNKEIEKLLVDHQRRAIETTLLLKSKRQTLDNTKELEVITQQTEEIQAETRRRKMALEADEATRRLERDLTVIDANAKAKAEEQTVALAAVKAQAQVHQVEIDQKIASARAQIALDKEAQANKLAALEAEVRAAVEKGKAFTPDLIAALTAFGDKELIERVSKSMAPLSILGGESVQEVLGKLLAGSPLAKHLLPAANGATSAPATAARS